MLRLGFGCFALLGLVCCSLLFALVWSVWACYTVRVGCFWDLLVVMVE